MTIDNDRLVVLNFENMEQDRECKRKIVDQSSKPTVSAELHIVKPVNGNAILRLSNWNLTAGVIFPWVAAQGTNGVSTLRQMPGRIKRECCGGVIFWIEKLAEEKDVTFHFFTISLTCFLFRFKDPNAPISPGSLMRKNDMYSL